MVASLVVLNLESQRLREGDGPTVAPTSVPTAHVCSEYEADSFCPNVDADAAVPTASNVRGDRESTLGVIRDTPSHEGLTAFLAGEPIFHAGIVARIPGHTWSPLHVETERRVRALQLERRVDEQAFADRRNQ